MNSPRLLDIPTVRTTILASALLILFKLIIQEETIPITAIGLLIFTAGSTAYLFKDLVNQQSYLSHFAVGVITYYLFTFSLLFFKIVEKLTFKEEAITGLVFGGLTILIYYFMRRI